MGKLSDYISSPQVKPIFRGRYYSGGTYDYFVTWTNQLLNELQRRGFLSQYTKEIGLKVTNRKFLEYPDDYYNLIDCYSPCDREQRFRVEDINGKLRLRDVEFDYSEDSFETASAFTSPTVDSITIDLSDKSTNVYENYLFYVTAGNKAGMGFVLLGNDASSGATTKLNFMYDLNTAFVTGDVTAAELIPPEKYVLLKYNGIITKITTVSDELAIDDELETQIVPVWLRWCCEMEAAAVSKETQFWAGEKDRILNDAFKAKNSFVNPAKGRRLVGMECHGQLYQKNHPEFPSAWPAE